jgi:hypothetical protein
MQPTYLSWLGYFDLIDSVDKFVFLDDVHLEKCSWHVRNKIKIPNGELYLTVPIKRTKGRDELIINEAIINDSESWRDKHLKSIYFAYKKSQFFDEVYFILRELLSYETNMLSKLTCNIITSLCGKMGIDKEFILSSVLKGVSGEKDARLVSMCREIRCNKYLSPIGSAAYIEKNSPGGEFAQSGIELLYHNYEHPVYHQLYGEFKSHISVIDLFFNHGFDKSLEIIRSGRRKPIDYLFFRKNDLKITEQK